MERCNPLREYDFSVSQGYISTDNISTNPIEMTNRKEITIKLFPRDVFTEFLFSSMNNV
jgi:hypothetical protein